MHRILVAALALLSTCDLDASGAPSDDDTSGGEVASSRPERLPDLPRLGDLAPGDYLFPRAALGAGESELVRARLVRVEPDAFVVSVDGGPHRRLPQSEAWPMACLRESFEHTEGDLAIRLTEGAPVLVLASSRDAARVSVGVRTEHSRVVHRDAIALEGCTRDAREGFEFSVAPTDEGDCACVFPDQETLDGSAGLPVPAGAPARVIEEDGEWALVEVGARGGTVSGWMSAALARGGPASASDWIATALDDGLCVFPGRVDPRPIRDFGEAPSGSDEVPTLPAIEVERVVRSGTPQIEACYQARLADVPDLTVEIEVLMLVDADGQVQRASITRGASADEALSRCIIERVSRWRFPAPRHGSVQVRRTFDLRPPE